MKKAKVVTAAVAAVIGCAAAVWAGAAQAQALQGEYKLGVLEPLTGNLATQGKLHLEGYEVMRDLINTKFGGVMGKKLVLVTGDGVDPTAAASEAARLATREGVKIITGTFSSILCGAASEAAARQNVIYWETSCVDPRFTKRGLKTAFRTEIDGTGFGWYNIEFIRETLQKKLGIDLKKMKVAFVSEDSAYGQGTTEAGKKRAQELGMTVLSVDYYNRNTMTDFTPVILKLKSSRPDVIVASCYTNDAILLWKQAKQLSLEVKAIISAGAVSFGSPDFGKSLGKDAEGVFALVEPAGLNPKAMSSEMAALEAEVAKRYEAKYNERYAASAQLGAAGVWILAEVLKKTGGDLNPDKVRAAALNLDVPVGGMLNGWGVKFGVDGQNTNERVQHYMLQWQDGRLVTVWPERFAVAPMRMVPLPKWSER